MSRGARRVALVVPSGSAGGIGPVCRYAAEGLAATGTWDVTLLSLHDAASPGPIVASGLRTVSLGLDGDCAERFLEWLAANPQDIITTNDVSGIEAAFPHLPASTRHLIHLHDCGRRYRAAAVRNAPWSDGVVCVARHIEEQIRPELNRAGFRGFVGTVHNGAQFPPPGARTKSTNTLRLLFMGRLDPFKGITDLPPLLSRLQRRQVDFRLNIVGGVDPWLANQFARRGLQGRVTWTGRLPHRECYQQALESDLILVLSRREPFGMVTIEAMSMGCVPLGYEGASGTGEIIERGRSGLLVPLGDLEAAADAIETLKKDRALLDSMSQAAVARAREQFSAKVMAGRLSEVLGKVLAGPPREGRTSPYPVARVPVGKGRRPVYQWVPDSLRQRLRREVCRIPRLAHWILMR